MDEKVIQSIADVYKVSKEKVIEAFEESKKFVEEQFKIADENTKLNRIYTITANKFKTNLSGNTTDYIGVVFGIGPEQDSNAYNRKMQLDIYYKTKQLVEQTGDKGALDEIIGKVVNIDENGEPVPLFSYYKKDGSVSAMAGQPIPGPEHSMVRTVYGICYPEDKADDAENATATFKIDLKGKAINNIPPMGKVVSFKAGGKEYNGMYMLNSSATDFVEKEDKYFVEGIKLVGLTEVGARFFTDKTVTFEMINTWVAEFESTKENPVPKEYRYLAYINNATCMSQNFQPNDKGKIGMIFCNSEFSAEGGIDVVSGAEPIIGDKIQFAQNSTCAVLGQISIFGKDDNPPMVYFNLYGAVPKKDEYIERQFDAKPIGEPDTDVEKTDTSKVEENKPETVKGAW